MHQYLIRFARVPLPGKFWGTTGAEAVERAYGAYNSQMGYTRADIGEVISCEVIQ